jgi:hypothetical protein
MDLLDRYLQAVRFWLPRAQQQDIIAELGDDLRSQIEDKESRLGCALNDDEMVALLRQAGHPMRVAGRYQPQQSLIGPTLFPLYKFVLKMATFVYLVPWILVWIALAIFVPSLHHEGWATLLRIPLVVFAIITLAFALLERFQSRLSRLEKWDPRKLPAAPKRKDRVSRVASVFELAFNLLFVVGWLAVPGIARHILAAAGNALAPSPGLAAWYWPVLVPVIVSMAQQFTNLFRPDWTWLRPVTGLATTAMTLGIVQAVIRTYPYFLVVAEHGKDAVRSAQVGLAVNQFCRWGLLIFSIGLFIALIVYAFQCAQFLRRKLDDPGSGARIGASQLL